MDKLCRPVYTAGGISPLGGYVGGKSRLARRIVARMPPHVAYVEPFCGAAWVLFKKSPSPCEVLNDASAELINFFEMVRSDPDSLADRCRFSLASRAMFLRLRATRPENLSPPDRAFRFYYLIRNTFGYNADFHSFQIKATGSSNYMSSRLPRLIGAAHRRLEKVFLECADWRDIIRRHDRPETFFYLDPPYFGCEDYYPGANFRRGDFAELARALGAVRGKFLLSINDRPETREIFRDFRQERQEVCYSLNNLKTGMYGEMLVSNYDYEIPAGNKMEA